MDGDRNECVERKPAHGLACPACGGTEATVYFTRHDVNRVRRVRRCSACGNHFVSHETVAVPVWRPVARKRPKPRSRRARK
jgi:transcriptional regulator NrdR family protein